jgi:hypothetical protein
MTVGGYLDAIRIFLEQDGYQALLQAIGGKIDRSCRLEEIEEIRIILEKHGEFYHPARVESVIGSTRVSFVVNGAVSNSGRNVLEREYRILSALRSRYGVRFVPKVYRCGCVRDSNLPFPVELFLGEWFEGFHEFHLAPRRAGSAATGIRVWGPDPEGGFLNPGQERDLYREAAAILTICYNVETFEQIYPWHHAAGDFIVCTHGEDVDVRLVTVRQYAPLIELEAETNPMEIKMDALLLFFMNMSLRMRLDRIDGTGNAAWSGSAAVVGAVAGFFKGLAFQAAHGRISPSDPPQIRAHLKACQRADLMEIAEMILAMQPAGALDTPLIKRYLESHVQELYPAIRAAG